MAEPIYTLIGRRVRVLRGNARMTQTELANRLDPPVSRACILNIEWGKQRILAHTIIQLAAIFSVSVADVLNCGPTSQNQMVDSEHTRRQRQRDKKRIVASLREVITDISRI